MSTKITKKTLIIVEGESDKKFFTELCAHSSVELEDFQIEKISVRGGKAEFFDTKKINAFFDKVSNNPQNVLLFCDADYAQSEEKYSGFNKTRSSLNVVRTKLRKKSGRNVEFFILPNHRDDGNLESLFLQCATSEVTKKVGCVESYLKCLGQEPSINKIEKLRAQLLISGMKHKIADVGDVVGKNGYWNLNIKKDDPLLALKEFLKKFK